LKDAPEALFDQTFRERPSAPFVTFYDQATGERAELSGKSLANWVAKTHFLLTDALGLGVGSSAYVSSRAHWMVVPVVVGCWTAGLRITTDPAGADVAFVSADRLDEAAGVLDVFALSLHALGAPFPGGPPEGAEDYVVASRPMPDAVIAPASSSDPALDDESRADLVSRLGAEASSRGLAEGVRLLSTDPWDGPSDWLMAIGLPLIRGGSLVLVANPDPARIDALAASEKAT
jgi:uncharacterized protein (TIGR03089 family)